MAERNLTLALSPRGTLRLVADTDAPPLPAPIAGRLGAAFEKGPGPGLLQLGGGEVKELLPPVLSWWRAFGSRYLTALYYAHRKSSQRAQILSRRSSADPRSTRSRSGSTI